MSPVSIGATIALIGWHALASVLPAQPAPADTALRGQSAELDGLGAPPMPPAGLSVRPVALARLASPVAGLQDTVPRRRAKSFEYSDAYYKRLALHKTLSWAMLPLFAVSYFSGDQLLAKGDEAPGWAKSVHPVAATSTAVLFGANAVTGGWNLWDGRKDPNGRTRRLLHSALFLAASGGFAYAGTTLADEAEESAAKRRDHRNLALTSMGVSTASWLIMLIGN